MKYVLIILLCVLSLNLLAQDERYYRSIFSGDLFGEKDESFPFKVAVRSKKYMIDLNRDGNKDAIQTLKKDGIDFIHILDEFGKTVFEGKLETKGSESSIFRVSYKPISKNVDVLIIHFYEGHTQAAVFEGTARLYFLTIIDRNLKNIKMQKGPYFWTEYEGVAGKYWNRRYTVNTVDYNDDGFREISTSFNRNNRVFIYADGLWIPL